MKNAGTIVIITQPHLWEKALKLGKYSQSTIDSSLSEVGFIHCSFPSQTMEIANRRFADKDKLILLLINKKKVIAPIKFEGALSGRTGTFPHIYGPLNVDAVYSTIPLEKKENVFVEPDDLKKLIKG